MAPVVGRGHDGAGYRLSLMPTRLHHRIFVALRSFLRGQTVERELDDELQFHLEQMEARELEHGTTQGDATHPGATLGAPQPLDPMKALRAD